MKVTLLGSSSELSTAARDHTFLAVEIQNSLVLADCAGSPAKKMLQAGLDHSRLDALLITRRRPDHIYGLVSLVHEMKLTGRERPLELYLPRSSLEFVRQFQTHFAEENEMLPVNYRPLDLLENLRVFANEAYAIYSTPVAPAEDSLAYKFVERSNGASVFVYCSDAQPSDALVRFAWNADLLVHDCTLLDDEPGARESRHTTARQAGEIAAKARVKRLALVHLGITAQNNIGVMLAQVRENFSGAVVVGEDLLSLQV